MPQSSTLTRIRAKALGTWDRLYRDVSALYAPLDVSGGEIRLVTLIPGHTGDEINCRLSTAFIDQEPSYEALSYAWGSTTSMRTIYINGRSYPVTENLHTALLHLRSRTEPRVLWIDAICINQIDFQERNSQVQHMGAIFHDASEVVAWLGEADTDSEWAFDTFETFYADAQLHWDLKKGNRADSKLGVEHGKAIENLFKRPWWHRVWTVQESVLAQNLVFVCGPRKIPAETIFKTCDSYYRHSFTCCVKANLNQLELPMNFLDRIRTARVDILNGRRRLNFPEIVARYRVRRSTNPRDKIYGLLGLAADEDIKLVVPDYHSPVPVVYEKFTLSSLQSSRDLAILSQICPQVLESQGPRTGDLPSWVPDFACNLDFDQEYTLKNRISRMIHFNATHGSRAFIHCLGPGKIILRGLILDTVTVLSGSYEHITKSMVSVYPEWQDMVGVDEQLERPYPPLANTTYYDAYRQTLCASFLPIRNDIGNTGKDRRTTNTSLHLKWHKVWWDWCKLYEGRLKKADLVSPDYTGADLVEYAQHITDATFMRKLFLTEKTGFVGLAPMSAEVGDKIALLEGGKVPYILRPQEDAGSECYELVGDAYAHGTMDGEAWKTDLLQEITLV